MENKIININSIFRDKVKYPNANNFRIDLPESFKNIIYIKISSIEMTDTNFVFSDAKNNNSFKIKIGDNEFLLNIGEGNFTSSILVVKIQELLDAINETLDFNILVDIDSSSAKLFFTTNSDNVITLDFTRNIETDYQNLKYHLGFNNDINTGSYIIAENVLNLFGFNYAFLSLNDIENVVDPVVSNVFCKIICDSGRFNTLFSNVSDFNSKDIVFRSPIDLNFIELKILDYMGNPFPLFNSDYSITIEIGYIYDIELYKKINNHGKPNGDTRLLYKY